MDTKYPWMSQTHLMGWSFISSVQVWAITPLCQFTISSKKDFCIKLVSTLLLIPADITVLPMRHFLSRARMMVVPPFDHTWRHQRSHESCEHHYNAQLIYRIQKSLLHRTMHFSQWPHMLLRTLWLRSLEINGLLFAFLYVSPSEQVRTVVRRNNVISREAKNNMVLHTYVTVISAHQFLILWKGYS